jgi:glycosyltransferase involved in cell wall biosynthesis
MSDPLRVAYFACAYNEIDGVATTSRQFEAYARRHNLPMLSIHGGSSEYFGRRDGSVVRYEFRRRWPKFALDRDHDFDLGFWRYYARIEKILNVFRPDVIHITGPSDVAQIAALAAHRLGIPLAASWHTNVHEYLNRRLCLLLARAPREFRNKIAEGSRAISLRLAARFYQMARVLFAPNRELADMLAAYTGKRVHLMIRGVDSDLFHPPAHERNPERDFTIGYVGRLTPEKNVRFFETLEKQLVQRGRSRFQFLIVGQGSEESWMRARLKHAVFTGVLQGEDLASAYRKMDLFAFPSQTDTYGNVIQEAAASGVPSVVMDGGGPKYIVAHEKTGLVSANEMQFIDHVTSLMNNRELLARMSVAARQRALSTTWDAVFAHVYSVYRRAVAPLLPSFEMIHNPSEI